MNSIHPETYIGPVHYTVTNLSRQVEFYRDVLGFQLLRREGDTAVLGTLAGSDGADASTAGAGARADDHTNDHAHGTSGTNGTNGINGTNGSTGARELLRMTEDPDAPRPRGTTGLYHTAFLVPTRWDLAQLVRRLIDTRTPVQGTSNHGTHLAMYLPDPEGNGIELAWDFPKEQWPMRDGRMVPEEMPREGIDLEQLFRELERDPSPWPGLPQGTTVGHIHLHVSDLDSSRRFYHETLGFDISMDGWGMGALFVSAGGYHHHIGMNVWKGVGIPAPPEGAAGLRYFTVVLPDEAELERVIARAEHAAVEVVRNGAAARLKDPSGNGLLLTIA